MLILTWLEIVLNYLNLDITIQLLLTTGKQIMPIAFVLRCVKAFIGVYVVLKRLAGELRSMIQFLSMTEV